MLCSLPQQTSDKDEEVVKILNDHFGGSCERKVLSHKLEQAYSLAPSTASMRINRAIKNGAVVCRDKIISLPTPEITYTYTNAVQSSIPIYEEPPF